MHAAGSARKVLHDAAYKNKPIGNSAHSVAPASMSLPVKPRSTVFAHSRTVWALRDPSLHRRPCHRTNHELPRTSPSAHCRTAPCIQRCLSIWPISAASSARIHRHNTVSATVHLKAAQKLATPRGPPGHSCLRRACRRVGLLRALAPHSRVGAALAPLCAPHYRAPPDEAIRAPGQPRCRGCTPGLE